MDELVPDFHVEQDYQISTSSTLPRSSKLPMPEDEIMELLWQNGQVVMQSQRPLKKPDQQPFPLPDEQPPSGTVAAQNLFMQEDEMVSWLHYPMEDLSFDRDLYSDLFYPQVSAPPPLPPVPRPSNSLLRQEPSSRVQQNFVHISRAKAARESSTVVDSSVTPVAVEAYGANIERSTEQVETSFAAGGGVERETRMSSPGGSGGSISASDRLGSAAVVTEDRKRKAVEVDDNDCQSEDFDFESPDAKKRTRGSTSAKRSRAAEVHNLSERRRRDRINEKMRALQELIPRCNKSDKASMLDEAIEYLKSLQMQVQMMSMGCGMVPMMFPGMQQYMPPMGMMGIEMGVHRPTMMPFLPMMPGSAMPNSATTAHLGPRFPMPAAYHMQQSVPLPNPTVSQDPMINSKTRNVNQPQMQFFSDPYQQYLGIQQVPLPQNQVSMQPSTSRPNSSREVRNHEDPKSGMPVSLVTTCDLLPFSI